MTNPAGRLRQIGAAVVINQYGPSGEPGLVSAGRNTGRIRYTGQIYLPELAPTGGPSQPLYSFKARIYAPKLGRFLQTDPIGALDDRNLYAYVGNDPINWTDPSGLAADAIRGKQQSNQCAGAPVAPGTGSTPDEMMAQARLNGAEAAKHSSWSPSDLSWFKSQVQNGGPWDYKQYSKGNPTGYQAFGNYNYGYTGAAAGYSLDTLLRQAGRAQVAAGTSQSGWGEPGRVYGEFGGTPPYGDDPNDQDRIKEGYNDRKNGC